MTGASSRIVGRGRLLYSLQSLRRRVEKFAVARASTPAEQAFARVLLDDLDAAHARALSLPGSRAALEAVDARRRVARKIQGTEARARVSRKSEPSTEATW
jgi:hypothetical protein